MPTESADLKKIFGSAIFGIVEDLAEAKDKGQELPGLLDKIGSLASKAKADGIDLLKYEVQERLKKYIPWVLLVIVLAILLYTQRDKL